ncbi:malonate decarboxylase, epsilon subunit [Streptomyces sp. C]|nr:malonate decarboxylase, epsilon subunit [Streptomyces sp. C]
MIGFLFSGQGVQEPGMTAALYRQSPLYRRRLDEADAALAPHLGGSVRDLLLGGDPALHRTRWAQPALFAVGHALAATLSDLGAGPHVVLGHSVGEFAAAVSAGVLTLEEAARLVAERARLMDALPEGGGMLAVRAGREAVEEFLDPGRGVSLAAVNGPRNTVLSGGLAELERVAGVLRGRGAHCRAVGVPHAFHSPLMDPVLEPLAAAAAGITPAAPRIPLASTRYGRLLADEPMDGAYWAAQAAGPVLFADALADLVARTAPTALVEIGPAPQLVQLAGRSGLADGIRLLHPSPGREATARDLAETVAALYRSGLEPQWDELYEPAWRTTERLPPYAFSTEHRFWHAAAARPQAPSGPAAAPAATPAGAVAGPVPAAAGGGGRDGSADPVLAAVVGAVVEVGDYAPERVDRNSRFYEDLGFDSVMIMQLKDRIETSLPQAGGIAVQQLLPALRSVGTLADFVGEWISVGVRP